MTTIRYVSPSGSNANSGQAMGQAWATLAFAQQQIRDLIAATPTEDITLVLAAGRHAITSTLEFTEADIGTYPGRVTWRAASGATPVISGGVVVDTWTLHDAPSNIWVADYAGPEFRQLYVDDIRCYRTRRSGLANGTYTPTGFTTTDDVTTYGNITDVELIFRYEWRESRVRIASAVASTSLTMQEPAQAALVPITENANRLPYAIENAYEILEADPYPLKFYWDRTAGKIYLIPPVTVADPNDAEVIVPQLSKLATFDGARRIDFDGIQWSHNTWLPAEGGFADIQSMVINHPGVYLGTQIENYGRTTPAAIEMWNSSDINFNGCGLTKLGSHGIAIWDHCDNIAVEGSTVLDNSGHGIVIGRNQTLNGGGAPNRIRIENNLISYCGQDYASGSGIFAVYCTNSTIDHNDFYQLPYSAVALGWGWGSSASQIINPAINNRITNNRYDETMLRLVDGAAIYCNGVNRGLIVEGNYSRNSRNGQSYYFDQGTFEASLLNNVSEGESDAWFKSHQGFGNYTIEGNHAEVPESTTFIPYNPALYPVVPPGAVEWTPVDPTTYNPASPTLEQARLISNAGRQPLYNTGLITIDPAFPVHAVGGELGWWLPAEMDLGAVTTVPDRISNRDMVGTGTIIPVAGSGGLRGLSFNGTSNEFHGLAFPNHPSCSWSFWVYKPTGDQSGGIFQSGSNSGIVGIGIGDTTFAGEGSNLITTKTLAYWGTNKYALADGWHHCVLRIDASSVARVSIDNVERIVDVDGTIVAPTGIFTFGVNEGGDLFTNMILNDIRFYGEDLSSEKQTKLAARVGASE